jgi:hypothetical protein
MARTLPVANVRRDIQTWLRPDDDVPDTRCLGVMVADIKLGGVHE